MLSSSVDGACHAAVRVADSPDDDGIGLDDLTACWGGLVEGGIMAKGTVIDWSVSSYMAGFLPCMMFGIPGAALTMIQTAKTKNRKVRSTSP